VAQRRLDNSGTRINAVGCTPGSAVTEAGVRQLIASGDHKTALEQAKELHKASSTFASESLLVDAYVERVRALLRRNLTVEAKALLDLVRQRYPTARTRLDELTTRVAPQPGSLDDLVRPLNNPDPPQPQRAAIERTLQREIWDLAALARCEALSVGHPVRNAAAALEAAFVSATSGPVADVALALPEVSHRSPLASWKQLTRAIASFYRGDDKSCQRYLEAIDRESAPGRVVPAIRAMLTGSVAAPLTPAAAALGARIASPSTLRATLEALDQAFASGNKSRILKAIRPAVDQCQQSPAGQLEPLRQHISVRCAVAGLDAVKVTKAMGGPSRHDATFLRLFARGMEETRNLEDIVPACKLWEEFRHAAVQEGWFAANGREVAALSLHIAGLLRQLPPDMMRDLQRSAPLRAQTGGEKLSFLSLEDLYRRACVLDPHPEAFSQWMEWAGQQPGAQAQTRRVAEAWHKIRPGDIEPVVRLMKMAETTGAFKLAREYAAKAERIDGLHPGVRGSRFRLLAGSALRHLQRRKPGFATEELAEMATLPLAQQGDGPPFLAALRFVSSSVGGDAEQAAASRADVERLLGSGAAAAMLLFVVASAAKQREMARLGPVGAFSRTERASLPGALARVTALATAMHLKFELPGSWMAEAAARFPAIRETLDAAQLRSLAESALQAGHGDLAYAVSAAGLERGGATEPRFLFIRAQSVTSPFERRVVCARAAAVLGRQQHDTELAEEAAGLVSDLFEFDHVSLTPDQARDVLRKEKAARELPTPNRPGPTYPELVGDCQCGRCRRARGEGFDPFEDPDDDDLDLDDEDFAYGDAPDMPPELAELLAREIEKSKRRGESVQEFLARLLAGESRRKRPRKRRLR
jgi:hypothetical protein